ncbi:hypothetical protein [[Phormidium] sp. ETS-05]|uniref:hypothetical protein n=1 Tax=[Phormidium] sp. ETS-05 TaxID=222819 RepID=UPI0018EECEF4|nr:hypothetical protein [[Phormidium] sp. ETS-05]
MQISPGLLCDGSLVWAHLRERLGAIVLCFRFTVQSANHSQMTSLIASAGPHSHWLRLPSELVGGIRFTNHLTTISNASPPWWFGFSPPAI